MLSNIFFYAFMYIRKHLDHLHHHDHVDMTDSSSFNFVYHIYISDYIWSFSIPPYTISIIAVSSPFEYASLHHNHYLLFIHGSSCSRLTSNFNSWYLDDDLARFSPEKIVQYLYSCTLNVLCLKTYVDLYVELLAVHLMSRWVETSLRDG